MAGRTQKAGPRQPRPRLDFATVGTSGLRQSGGRITEEFVAKLQGERGRRTYREMADNDPVVGAMLFAVSMLVRNAEWSVEPAGEGDGEIDDRAMEEAAFVEQMLFSGMSQTWADFVDEVCSMFTYGFSLHEICWRREGGRIVVDALPGRSQISLEEWRFEPGTELLLGVMQRPESAPQAFIPADKFVLFRTTSVRANPEGRSILRNSVSTWARKAVVEEGEGRAAIRAAGIVTMTIPGQYMDASAGNDEKQVYEAYKLLALNLAKDQTGSLILPSDRDENGHPLFDFRYVAADGRRPADMGPIIERYDRRMAMSILAQFLFLGQQSVGSFALSSDQTELFSTALKAWLRSIAGTINRSVIARVWALNGLPPETRPSLVPGDVEGPDFDKLTAGIQRLAASGAELFPNTDLTNELLGVAGLETRIADDEVVPRRVSEDDA